MHSFAAQIAIYWPGIDRGYHYHLVPWFSFITVLGKGAEHLQRLSHLIISSSLFSVNADQISAVEGFPNRWNGRLTFTGQLHFLTF